MEHILFSIRDSKGDLYNTPFVKKTVGEAERTFATLVNDEKSLLSQYPEDFDLYQLGQFDESSGKIKASDTPLHIIKGVALKRAKPQISAVQTN